VNGERPAPCGDRADAQHTCDGDGGDRSATDLGNAAQWYADELGWPVFPCEPRGKRPLTTHGLHDATTVPSVISSMWARSPDANIGIPTGAAFDVLDVDGDEGFDELERLVGGEDAIVPGDPVVRTPNGLHLYFTPTGLGNRARFAPGLDWRGLGGYVIVPPSIGASGVRYGIEWAVTSPDEFPIAPGFLTDMVDRERRDVGATVIHQTPQNATQRRTPVRSAAYVLRALEREAREVASTPEGQRNDRLNVAAYNLGRFVADGVLDIGTVERVLLAAASENGLIAEHGERSALATIRSGLRARGIS
jgi:hypothetical protein